MLNNVKDRFSGLLIKRNCRRSVVVSIYDNSTMHEGAGANNSEF